MGRHKRTGSGDDASRRVDPVFEVTNVPNDARIIEGRPVEVNTRRGALPRATLLCAMVLLLASCASDEERARERYREGVRLAQEDSLARAVEIFDEVARDYPRTQAGEDARRDAVLYRGLSGAVERYPSHRARDLMVDVARRVERWKNARRTVPPDLATVFGDEPPPVDPWGRALGYRVLRNGRSYEIAMYGADGEPGGEGNAADLVVRDGEFVVGR